jgi:hypothetical protein
LFEFGGVLCSYQPIFEERGFTAGQDCGHALYASRLRSASVGGRAFGAFGPLIGVDTWTPPSCTTNDKIVPDLPSRLINSEQERFLEQRGWNRCRNEPAHD